MPYADPEEQRRYNRQWSRLKRDTAANGPLCRAVEAIVALADPEPVSPSFVHEALGRSTRKSIGVALDRLKHGGRVANVGYGQWVLAEGNTLAADIRHLVAFMTEGGEQIGVAQRERRESVGAERETTGGDCT